ncbi:hypothetical protein ACJW30_11G143700 [Castanea mollissima]
MGDEGLEQRMSPLEIPKTKCACPSYSLFSLQFVHSAISSHSNSSLTHMHKSLHLTQHESWHWSILKSLSSSPADDEEELLLYSYSHALHGFSARLTPTQLSEIQNSSAHVATYPESFGRLLTTHTPKFLGLQQNYGIWPTASYGEGVIVGVIDLGIWPESESFSDEGMPSVPQRWKGKCENGTGFGPSNCNRKLIGARSFSKGFRGAGQNISNVEEFNSARDYYGHGTHTASTAVGNHVPGVSYFGYARGTASGMAPRAHLAMYKVHWADEPGDIGVTDVLAGMEQAIRDGVDIMSLSLGYNQSAYFLDAIAKGALSATEKGIFVACAAGNEFNYATVENGAPWITTVGAGTLDRSFLATMTLENGLTIEGTSYFPESIFFTNLTLYYGNGNKSKELCKDTALDRNEVAGKVVICDSQSPENCPLPSLLLSEASANLVIEYVTKERNPKVKSMTFVHTKLRTKPAPQAAVFSSNGPNPITPGILKPDIIAPGMDVLAAYVPNKPRVTVGNYGLVTNYALSSGTSMSTPVVAAIRSALMTTAYVKDNNSTSFKTNFIDSFATPLQVGAGHIDPNKAMDPGLIYDTSFQDYVDFLCGLGYTNEQMRLVLKRNEWHCNKKLSHELNYPSFMVVISNQTTYPMSMNFSRVVTNVGNDTSSYQAHLENIPDGMKIRVEPSTLTFTQKNQKQSFVLSVEIDKEVPRIIYCFLKWIDQHGHIVSSPIAAANHDAPKSFF